MLSKLIENLVFPGGRLFIPFPVRRVLLAELEEDPLLHEHARRFPSDVSFAARAWSVRTGAVWQGLVGLLGSGAPQTANDWLSRFGPLDSDEEEHFVRGVLAPILTPGLLQRLRPQVVFHRADGSIGRLDFAWEIHDLRVGIEVDGSSVHEGPGPDGRRPEQERKRQNDAIGAGYKLLRYTAREIREADTAFLERVRSDLEGLGLFAAELDDGAAATPAGLDPWPATLLVDWPRWFVQGQQLGLDLLQEKGLDWFRQPRTLWVPRSLDGAVAAGLLDVLHTAEMASDLLGQEADRARVEILVGDCEVERQPFLRALGRTVARGRGIRVRRSAGPDTADALLIPAECGVIDEAELGRWLEPLGDDGAVFWAGDVDAPVSPRQLTSKAPSLHPTETVGALLLDRFFGFASFRQGQWPIIERLLRGQSVLGVLPTGAGKTVCFQLPALVQPGVTLVVSPLVSLMDDQIMNLRAVGLDFAGRVHSRLADDESEEELRRFKAGEYKLFYISPERFHSRRFLSDLATLVQDAGLRIDHIAVDEAHLASEWGHDFRPSYLTLPHAHAVLAPDAPVALLTATAPTPIRADLARLFHKVDLQVVLPDTFDRPELSFEIHPVHSEIDRQETLEQLLLESVPRSLGHKDFATLHALDGADQVRHGGLIFAPWGKPSDKAYRNEIRAEAIHGVLERRGVPAALYRGGDGRAAINRYNQERFKRNEVPLVVATKGFGTGIDKPDIRYTIHADLPGSLESLYQEAGRAGRDGRDARSAAIWRPRHPDCDPGSGPPGCVSSGTGSSTQRCPFKLDVHCSFGVQANLRSSNMPGAVKDIEQSIDVWRTHFAPALKAGQTNLRVPRAVKDPELREEIRSETPDILLRLAQLELCGPPSLPRDPRKPIFVENRVLDTARLKERVKQRAQVDLNASSDEQLVQRAVELYFGLSRRASHRHAAVWAMYLRHRQHITDKKSAVPRMGSDSGRRSGKASAHVERFITRLIELGVADSYAYASLSDWDVELRPPSSWSPPQLAARVTAYRRRFRAPPLELDDISTAGDAIDAVEDALSVMIQTWYETIAKRSWESLQTLEEFAAATDCRRARITQYMNEAAVSFPVPCGHCDNCGIEPYEPSPEKGHPQRPRDEAIELRERFQGLAGATLVCMDVAELCTFGEDTEQMSAIRDMAARHLEREPTDLPIRLAAALASDQLGESRVARRHGRTLLEHLPSAEARRVVPELVERVLSTNLLRSLEPELRSFASSLAPLPSGIEHYRLDRRLSTPAAARSLTRLLESATLPLTQQPGETRG